MTLEKAILIAITAHQGQVDKAGAPYILHPFRVMFGCKTEDEQICAVLHDVIEDTVVTLKDLRAAGFKEEIIIALNALTKRKNETYDDFINKVIQNQLACHVKLADLSDNMNLSRISNPSEEDYQRVEKYGIAADRIVNALAAFADDSYVTSKEIEINGCISVPEHCMEDEVLDKFIDFIESNHWYFGGGLKSIE
jgi:(p)ppGpp synthase/HD superfamily hydrolase